jgi:hypothetical protein
MTEWEKLNKITEGIIGAVIQVHRALSCCGSETARSRESGGVSAIWGRNFMNNSGQGILRDIIRRRKPTAGPNLVLNKSAWRVKPGPSPKAGT